MRLILLGPPGAGKGTQAELLKNEFGIPHISTGDILRQVLKENSALANKVRGFVESGELVPDDIVLEIIRLRLLQSDTEKGFILDGFPRTINQAEGLDKVLAKLGKNVVLVLYFASSLPVIIKRLAGRRVCADCGANYHIKNMPPKNPGICDICRGTLYQRKDDQEETIRRRIEVYLQQTAELVKYYESRNILRTIDGDRDAQFVNAELNQLFSKEGLLPAANR
jgi:adenylate kinase